MAGASTDTAGESLVNASHHVHEQLEASSCYWDLSDLLNITKNCMYCVFLEVFETAHLLAL